MRAQQIELIYSQSSLLYENFPDAPRSILDMTRQKSRPHADGIVSSAQENLVDQLSNQLQQLSIQQPMTRETSSLDVPPI
jgi:hypothetical protein